jgi:hypothetical protein
MRVSFLSAMLVAGVAVVAQAVPFSMVPLAGFGGSDGWLAPSEAPTFLEASGDRQRDMAYNPVTQKLVVVSRTGGNQVRLVDQFTGGDLGTMNLGSGVISGGAIVVNGVGVGEDGAVYVGNVTSAMNTGTGAFKIYRWSSESASAPTVAFSGATLTGARLGDSFDVVGSGASTRIVAGYSNNPSVVGNNGYSVFTTSDGATFAGQHQAFAGATPAAGDFRLGITFGSNASTVLGTQGSSLVRLTTYSAGIGALGGSSPLVAGNERPMDFAVVNGVPLLATIDSGSSSAPNSGTLVVRVYDMTNPLTPVVLGTGKNTGTATLSTNGNASGAVAFGRISGDTAYLYALGTNNGIQAFQLTVIPEASSFLAVGAVGMLFAAVRRFRRR